MLEHPGEVRLRLRASSFGELAATAGRALAELELKRVPPTAAAADVWREVTVAGRDRAALLVNWLNELIYLAETERWVGTEFALVRETPTGLAMRVKGITVDRAPSQVKAATFHGLRIAASDTGVQAEVVLDV